MIGAFLFVFCCSLKNNIVIQEKYRSIVIIIKDGLIIKKVSLFSVRFCFPKSFLRFPFKTKKWNYNALSTIFIFGCVFAGELDGW